MFITEFKKIGKTGKRYRIFLSSGETIILSDETIVKNNLKTGDEITLEEIEDMQFNSERQLSFEIVVDYLSRGIKTEKQIFTYLKNKGYCEKVIDYTIEKLKEYRLIDDGAYAKMYVKSISKNKGRNLIKQELLRFGVDKKTTIEALEEIENEEDTCQRICEKYAKNKEKTLKNKQKTYNYLISKGFSYDNSLKATDNFFRGSDNNEDWN